MPQIIPFLGLQEILAILIALFLITALINFYLLPRFISTSSVRNYLTI